MSLYFDSRGLVHDFDTDEVYDPVSGETVDPLTGEIIDPAGDEDQRRP